MTLDEEKYYNTYFDLFLTDGWKQFIQEIDDIHSSYRIEDIRDEGNLNRVKGERAMLFKVLRFEAGITRTYDVIKEREADA